MPFCSTEPRIKGSFEGLGLIYNEVCQHLFVQGSCLLYSIQILFVLHQIVDRMDNMLQLRTAYGSGPLEELNVTHQEFKVLPIADELAGSDLSIPPQRCRIYNGDLVRLTWCAFDKITASPVFTLRKAGSLAHDQPGARGGATIGLSEPGSRELQRVSATTCCAPEVHVLECYICSSS